MKDYGKALLAELPDECTEFLKRLCTHYTPTGRALAGMPPCTCCPPFSSIVTNYHLLSFVVTPLLSAEEADSSQVQRAEPQHFIASYVNRPEHLRTFLSFMIAVGYLPACGALPACNVPWLTCLLACRSAKIATWPSTTPC